MTGLSTAMSGQRRNGLMQRRNAEPAAEAEAEERPGIYTPPPSFGTYGTPGSRPSWRQHERYMAEAA